MTPSYSSHGGGLDPREILLAEMVLSSGRATTTDVVAALQRCWDDRDEDRGTSFAQALCRIAGLEPTTMEEIEKRVDELLAEAGGDPMEALVRLGGVLAPVPSKLLPGVPDGQGGLTRIVRRVGAPLRTVSPDRYVDLEVIGEGGMGVVYLALDTELNRLVALKMIRSPGSSQGDLAHPGGAAGAEADSVDPALEAACRELKLRFLQEAWVTGGLEHPSIVPVYEVGRTESGDPYYTMRFVRGLMTLADAIAQLEGTPLEERFKRLESFLKMCDAVRYAHSRGVIHRDLKPANVALGEFGEVVVLDWGLAKLMDREDFSASRWQQRVQDFRTSGGPTTDAAALGTPGYMSPEALTGKTEEVDELSDVYSLSAILFELLTGQLPHQAGSYRQLVEAATSADVPRPSDIDPEVPEALASLCAAGLDPDRRKRPAGAQAIVDAIRSWQNETAAAREVKELKEAARTAIETARHLEGDARLRVLARASAALEQLAGRGTENSEIDGLRQEAEQLFEQGVSEQVRVRTKTLFRRVSVATAVLILVLGVTSYAFLVSERDDVSRAARVREAAVWSIAIRQDAAAAERLLAQADDLWPAHPSQDAALTDWLAEARALTGRRSAYTELAARAEADKISLDVGSPGPPGEGKQELSRLLDTLDRLGRRRGRGTVSEVERRRRSARGLMRRTLKATTGKWTWQRVTDELADATTLPIYGTMALPAQPGLVPLGPDPKSGLLEFALLMTGATRARDAASHQLVLDAESGIVFVLLPPDPEGARAILISKFELTSGEWARLEGKEAPGVEAATARHPISMVSAQEARRTLRRNGMDLPTEQQWRRACAAGGASPPPGSPANVADRTFGTSPRRGGRPFEATVDDGHALSAPVGSFPANEWGLHDMAGNVAEWCLARGEWPGSPSSQHVAAACGGSWATLAKEAGCSARRAHAATHRDPSIGVRAVISLLD